MFDIFKKLLLGRQISFEEGEIKLLGQSITMIPVELYVAMFKELKNANPTRYGEIIYNIAKDVGKKYTLVLKKRYSIKTSREVAQWDMNTLALAGLGKGTVLRYDTENKKALVKVENSPIARGLKPQKTPIDFIIAGYIAGSSNVAFKSENMECKEIKCEAMGHRYCLFEVYEKKSK